MGATETVDLFLELINDDDREKAVNLFADNAVLGVSTPGSDERTNLRGRDRVGGWFVRAGNGFRMYANDGRSMGSSYIADVTVMRPGINPMRVEANFRVENGQIVALSTVLPGTKDCAIRWKGQINRFVDCHGDRLRSVDLDRYSVSIGQSGSNKGLLLVDLRHNEPAPSTLSTTTSAA